MKENNKSEASTAGSTVGPHVNIEERLQTPPARVTFPNDWAFSVRRLPAGTDPVPPCMLLGLPWVQLNPKFAPSWDETFESLLANDNAPQIHV